MSGPKFASGVYRRAGLRPRLQLWQFSTIVESPPSGKGGSMADLTSQSNSVEDEIQSESEKRARVERAVQDSQRLLQTIIDSIEGKFLSRIKTASTSTSTGLMEKPSRSIRPR